MRCLYLMIVAVLVSACGAGTEPERPNIVLIFADDVGYGDLSSYGHPTIRTPVLDRLAWEGIKLTSFYAAAPACSPSRASILTGRYPVRAGVPHVYGPEETSGLAPEEITLAEVLGEAGYRTAAVGKWHLGSRAGLLPGDQGFDEYFGLLYSNDMIRPWVGTDRPLEVYRNQAPIDTLGDQSMLTTRYTEEAVRFIEESGDEPFFLYMAHSMAHVPLYVHPDRVGTSNGGRYGDVMEELDWSTGEIMDALERSGAIGNTIVIFTSDNGPWMAMPLRMFGDPRVVQGDHGTTGGLRGSKASTWEGGHRVPFIAWWPGQIPGARTSSVPAHTMDVFTTLVGLGGAAIPEDRVIDGRDLWPLLTSDTPPEETPFFYQYPSRVDAVRLGDYKLHVRRLDGVVDTLLFDLSTDPFERFNVADDHPDLVADLWERMQLFADEVGGTVAE